MEYRRLGKSGLKVSELSYGTWINFGASLDLDGARECMRAACDAGVNFFDTAEEYNNGASELILGEALKEYSREDLVISTKIFWGGKGPNATGLSRKHLIEGTRNSLRRLQLDYVDLLYCHRPDPNTPIEETVRAMDHIINKGYALYWGTSEWSAVEIEEAFQIAQAINAMPPSMEQPEYNLFQRQRVEVEYAPLYARYGLGTTIYSPLASGILTGKYNQGIPQGSRLFSVDYLKELLTNEKIAKVKSLSRIAYDLECTVGQLALAWCLVNPYVSSVISGASNPKQIQENVQAMNIKRKLTSDVLQAINNIFR